MRMRTSRTLAQIASGRRGPGRRSPLRSENSPSLWWYFNEVRWRWLLRHSVIIRIKIGHDARR
jgi:hypothetical protein